MHLPWRSGRLEGTDLADQSSCGGLFFIWRSHGFTTSSQLFTVAVAPSVYLALSVSVLHVAGWLSFGPVFPGCI